MSKKRDWVKVGEIAAKIKELGLSYKEGAERFGISVRVLYEYSRSKTKEDAQRCVLGRSVPRDCCRKR